MIDLLLGFEPALLGQGTVELQVSTQTYGLAVLAIAAAIALLAFRSARREPEHARALAGCAALRACALALVLAMLLRPVLVVDREEPLRGAVAVLVDDSASMRLADLGGATRGEAVRALLTPGPGSALQRLRERFEVHAFRFGATAEPLPSAASLRFDANVSDLGAALSTVAETLEDDPLAAVVLVSDGADTRAGRGMDSALLALRARGVAVHAVAAAPADPPPDLELSAVRLPPTARKGDVVAARVLIKHHGLGGQRARLRVEDDGVLLHTEALALSPGGSGAVRDMELELGEAGRRELTFSVELDADSAPGEALLANNRTRALIDVDENPIHVLHFEGEPRFEVKFLRRAVFDDPGVRLVSLVRTAENKHYRLGVSGPDELADGFPTRAADLFAFDAVVLGSVSSEDLSPPQQELLADFVARRGGGLLALGGHRALDRGGFSGSRLPEMLPVVLPAGSGDGPAGDYRRMAKVHPTRAGARHPLTRIGPAGDAAAWPDLPPLTVVNPLSRLKPGATLLLAGEPWDAGAGGTEAAANGEALAILAVQRYGRGRVAALPVRDSWRWQINRDIAHDDLTHETFWRQLLRWLAGAARPRVAIEVLDRQGPAAGPGTGHDRLREAPVGERITVEATILDRAFEPASPARVELEVVTPLGDRLTLPMPWSGEQPGVHRADLRLETEGPYELEVRSTEPADPEDAAARPGEAEQPAPPSRERSGPESGDAEEAPAWPLRARAGVLATATGREFFGATLGRAVLDHVAARTGGTVLEAAAIAADPGALARTVQPLAAGRLVERRLPLWNTPLLLLALLALLCGEWLLRRRSGLR